MAYDIILADPAWPFETYSDKGKSRSPEKYYPTMPIEQIAALRVEPLTADNCALFLWTVKWLPLGVYDYVAGCWGFRYATRAFTWIKLAPRSGNHRAGNGYYTRSQVETCYLYVRGSMPVTDRGVAELIYSPLPKEHSRKPEEQYSRIERLYPVESCPARLELFARRRRAGWDVWGNEVKSDIELAGWLPKKGE
jgi:N6-adenosine-specific RNA methylase IME4